MNKDRRAQLDKIKSKLESLSELVEDIKCELEAIRDEEQEYFDNMPESMQNGERGEKANEAIEHMETVLETLGELDSEEMSGEIEEAQA